MHIEQAQIVSDYCVFKFCHATYYLEQQFITTCYFFFRLEDFAKRGNNDRVLSSIVTKSFTILEEQLLKTHEIVTVLGKRGNAVPIIIPPDTHTAMKLLIDPDIRKRAQIKSTNCYVFANTVKHLSLHSIV